MFYHLLTPLRDVHIFFNLFRYITFRAAYATVTALLIAFILGPVVIRWLRAHGVGQIVRSEGPERHFPKAGTPTMGGLILLPAIIVPTIFWADLTNPYVYVIIGATLWMGALGFWDDYLKAVRGSPVGMIIRRKQLGMAIFGLILGLYLVLFPFEPERATATTIPFLKTAYLDLGIFYVPFVIVVIMGCTNAVNLADGLDGLAIGLVSLVAFAFAGFAYLHGHALFSDYLQIPLHRGVGELAIFAMSLVGAGMGFLWFNAHPAEIFMGDTGSLALGGAVGTMAVLLKSELVLLIVGGVFVMEAFSVILQIASYRLRGRRLFLMTPIHHHFELKGWAEPKVVTRFYILGALCALVALSTLKIR